MITLALESTARACSCALVRDGRTIGQSFQNAGLTHSVTLLPMAQDMLRACGVTLREVRQIAVARGPGSFTGVRIGVALAKGLAFGLDIPVCGVSTLEAMACQGLCAPSGCVICCAMDARRGQIYNALFTRGTGDPAADAPGGETEGGGETAAGGGITRLCGDRAIAISDLAAELTALYADTPVFLVGDGAELCAYELRGESPETDTSRRRGLRGDIILAPENIRLQTAWGVAMAARYAKAGDCHELTPVYLRKSQAEREREGKSHE